MTTLRYLTAGESHGPGLTAILEGMPAGMKIDEDYIAQILKRRQKGFGSGGRMKIEKDFAKIKSGVRHGETLGSPIALHIENLDYPNWEEAMAVSEVGDEVDKKAFTRVVPGHADLAGALKYSRKDLRDVLERASARETTARTAVGAIALKFLEAFGIEVLARVVSIGDVFEKSTKSVDQIDWDEVRMSDFRTDDEDLARQFRERIMDAKHRHTTVGGTIEVIATSPPVGLGSHVHWDRKLDGRIAQNLISINAVKGVEVGQGFKNTTLFGHDVQDVVYVDRDDKRVFKRKTNNAGGIEGGMSNGEPIVVRVAIKPIATLAKPLPSVDISTGETLDATYNRSDVCQVPRACAIVEACLGFVLADAMLEKFGGDCMNEVLKNFDEYIKTYKNFGGREKK